MNIYTRIKDIIKLHDTRLDASFGEVIHISSLCDERVGQISYEYETMLNALIAIIDYHDLNINSTNEISGTMCSLAINAIRNINE